MSSIYEYLKNDKENTLHRIIKSLFRKLFIHHQFMGDVTNECLIAWMEAEYDPFYDNDGITAYAYRHARMHLAEWRRRNLLPATMNRNEKPEPLSIPFDALHGDDLTRLLRATEDKRLDPLELLIREETPPKPPKGPQLNDIQLPDDVTGTQHYAFIIDSLAKGEHPDWLAEQLGVSKRTIYRRINRVRDFNRSTISTNAV